MPQALIGGKYPYFLHTNKQRSCGRRDGGQHKSIFKYRITTNVGIVLQTKLHNSIRRGNENVNTFLLFPSSESAEPVRNYNMEL